MHIDLRPTAMAPMDEVNHRPARSAWQFMAVGAAVLLGAVLRFVVRSDLWLDEVLSVNIARLPLSEIPGALRQDGSPPLYYLLLHGWIELFGTGDFAVRALSGVLSLASLPLFWLAGRRLGGPRVGLAALVLAALNPFLLHYATETRMYSLVVFECLVAILALLQALERPTIPRLAILAASAAALLLTQYWAFYLIPPVMVWLAWRMRRSKDEVQRRSARRVLAAAFVGTLGFLPWLPSFLYQSAHTGTPWSRRPRLGSMMNLLAEFSGGGSDAARALGFSL